MLKSGYNLRKNNLISPAYAYRQLGYSIIPVRSNKISLVPWKRYQAKYVTEATHRNWWHRQDVAGIGIVTGAISHLAVLDFDNLQHYLDFKTELPHLMKTYQVKTRRGFHLYFRIASTLTTQSIKADGLDWLWEGRYVVAAPSIIQGIKYAVIQKLFPKMVTETELRQIETFIQARQHLHKPIDTQPATDHREFDLVTHYKQVKRYGRNYALFETSCIARDLGYSIDQTKSILLEEFISDRKLNDPQAKRQLEGIRTIQSAYTREPRKGSLPPKNTNKKQSGLPNEIRERLCEQKNTAVIRVWETLKYLQPNTDYITEDQLAAELQHIVGKYSIRQALQTTTNNKRFFTRTKKLPKRLSKLCSLDTMTNPKKTKTGRKKYYYRIPTLRDFCRLLDIKPIYPSDEISLDHLKSARTTRLALHIGFICRSPGKYPLKWLAKRLGTSVRTVQRYNRMNPRIHAIPVYLQTSVHWSMIAWLPDEPLRGTCFVDENNQCYPSIPQLARKLIAQGRKLIYRRRTVNYYCYGPSVNFDALYIRCA